MDSASSGSNDGAAESKQLSMWRRNNPFIQILLFSMCLFCNPGLYQAIGGLGAGGGKPSSITMADTSNGVLYGVFTFSAIAASSLINVFGPRLTTLIGITGYPIYTGAMWYFDSYGHLWFPVLAGAYLGCSAGCLWTTASYMANSYPEEKDKGKWRAIQWAGNLGGSTVGSCIALGINWNAKSEGVPHSVYIAFVVIQLSSVVFALMIMNPARLVRNDGTRIAEFKPKSLKAAFFDSMQLFRDWRIIILLPAMFVPEMFMPLQSSMNAYAYNLRTRSLNNVLNFVTQIPTVVGCGYLLDNKRFGRRKRRIFIALSVIFVWYTGTYIAQTIWLASWKFDRSVKGPSIDVNDAAYPGAVIIYLLYGGQWGMFQNTIIYLVGALANDPYWIANVSGLFVGYNAGTAVSFACDATAQPYMNENAAFFALTMICWPSLFYVTYKYATDTNYFKEAGVIVPIHVRKEMHMAQDQDVATLEGMDVPETVVADEKRKEQ